MLENLEVIRSNQRIMDMNRLKESGCMQDLCIGLEPVAGCDADR